MMRHFNRSTAMTLPALVVGLVACTVPNPNYRPRADASTSDAGTSATINVSITGDDAADGITVPVKTLRRAIALANGSVAIKTIKLSAGKYDVANGESFPYAVPAGVKVVGDSGVIFAGTTVETGIVLESGALENIQFEHFMIAIRVTGTAQLTNITVTTGYTGVVADGMANLSASGLTIIGGETASCLSLGLSAKSMANVTVDKLVAMDVIAVAGTDQSVVAISKGNVTKSHTCRFGVVNAGGKSFTLTDTLVSGGDYGVLLTNFSGLRATLTNTIVADSLQGIVGEAHVFEMTNGGLHNHRDNGAHLQGGTFAFTNVSVKGNSKSGIDISSQSSPATLTMRGCSVTGNGNGVALREGASGDFGTAATPGNNTIRDNAMIGLLFDHSNQTVWAAGNIWTPGVQGADAQGKYGPQLFTGSALPSVNGNNFGMISSVFLHL